MPSSLFNVTVTKPQDLQIRLDDEQGHAVAWATARGNSWIVEVLAPTPACFSMNTYLSQAKMTEILQALVLGYQVMEKR